MSVTLHADKSEFDIKSYGSEEQLVAGRSFAQWEWDVTPLEYGERTLHLKAVVNIASDQEKGAYDIPVIDRPIKVKINPPYIAAQVAKSKETWTILLGSGFGLVVVSGLTALIVRRRKQHRDEKTRKWEII